MNTTTFYTVATAEEEMSYPGQVKKDANGVSYYLLKECYRYEDEKGIHQEMQAAICEADDHLIYLLPGSQKMMICTIGGVLHTRDIVSGKVELADVKAIREGMANGKIKEVNLTRFFINA